MARKATSREARVAESPPTAGQRIQSFVQRIERLAEERKVITTDVAEIYKEVKSAGFDVKVMRQVIRRRQRDPSELEDEETMIDTYEHALRNAGSNSAPADEGEV